MLGQLLGHETRQWRGKSIDSMLGLWRRSPTTGAMLTVAGFISRFRQTAADGGCSCIAGTANPPKSDGHAMAEKLILKDAKATVPHYSDKSLEVLRANVQSVEERANRL